MNSSPALEDKDSEISAIKGNVLISKFYNFSPVRTDPASVTSSVNSIISLSQVQYSLHCTVLLATVDIIASLSAVIKRLRKSSSLLFQCKSYM